MLRELADQSVGGVDGENGRWAEYLTHDETAEMVAIAPHGGQMEPGTAEQALRVAALLDSCSGWAYCGYVDDGSARERYYTTSTAIALGDHELLSRLADHTFDVAIAFHGYRPDGPHPDVYLGGTLDTSAREVLAASIAQASGLDVGVAQPKDGLKGDYGGVSDENIVNRLAPRSVQLEQTDDARDSFRTEICRGLADGIRQLDSRAGGRYDYSG